MKDWKRVGGAVVVMGLAGLLVVFRDRIHFDWGMFFAQLRLVSWWHVAAGVGLIHATFLLRAWRWRVFCTPTKKVKARALVGPQFIGFTAVALFGRLADLTRPYLLAKVLELPVAGQVAVYTVERMFDLGAAAIVFSLALALAPANLPNRASYVHVGEVSLAATVALGLFAVFVRVAGGWVAGLVERGLGRVSPTLGRGVAEKIVGFRDGLNAIRSVGEFLGALGLSLGMWGMIGEAYVQTLHAFVATPELAELSYARAMGLFAASIGGSLLQLPVVGWFTQIAVNATAMREFYGAPVEAATACAALLLVVTTLGIVPVGLLFARLEQVSVGDVAKVSKGK